MVVHIEDRPQHMVLHHVSWGTFERLLDEIGETHLRATYDNGDLEFMTISLEHDSYGRWIGRLIFFIALELNVPIRTGGSTTLKQSLKKVGLEPDECFWTTNAKAMQGKKKWIARRDPPPDLAVEVDITTSWLDRLGIYAALQVPEVWRWDGKSLKVLMLTEGEYQEMKRSHAFPALPLDGLVRFIKRLADTDDEGDLFKEFMAWMRDEVVGKTDGTRKNGKKK